MFFFSYKANVSYLIGNMIFINYSITALFMIIRDNMLEAVLGTCLGEQMEAVVGIGLGGQMETVGGIDLGGLMVVVVDIGFGEQYPVSG